MAPGDGPGTVFLKSLPDEEMRTLERERRKMSSESHSTPSDEQMSTDGEPVIDQAAAETVEQVGLPTWAQVGGSEDEVSEAARTLAAAPRSETNLPQAALDAIAELNRTAHRLAVMTLPAPGKPMEVARHLKLHWNLVRFNGASQVGRSVHWRGDWFDHVGSHYQVTTRRDVEDALWRTLADAEYVAQVPRANGDGTEPRRKPWNPTTARVKDVMRALETLCSVSHRTEPGSWVTFPTEEWLPAHADDTGSQGAPVACQNVLVDVTTGQTRAHDSRYLNTYCLPFEYDPTATCPRWDAFLESVFPGDQESQQLAQEWVAYVLSGRTDIHKMLFLKGVPRAGKGVFSRVLTKLMGGVDNVAAPTMQSFVSDNGLASFIGKPLAIVDDARSAMRGSDMQAAISKLLTITGGGSLDIPRKYKEAWTGQLPTRVMIGSNELTSFRDSSGAIVNRMLLLVFKVSFLGKEDLSLEPDLEKELPGILNWALRGYQTLTDRGYFLQPKAGLDELSDFQEEVSPIGAWLNQECVQGDQGTEEASGFLFQRWVAWCEENGHKPGGVNGFLRLVKTVWPEVTRLPNKITDSQGKRVKGWAGIRYQGPAD